MRRRVLALIIGIALIPASYGEAPTFEIEESVINRVLSRIGTISDGGVAQPYRLHEIEGIWEHCFTFGLVNCFGNSSRQPGLDGPSLPVVACIDVGGGVTLLPEGDAVSWHWWVSNAYVSIESGQMTFTAAVVYRVGNEWHTRNRTVPAGVIFDEARNRFLLNIEPFNVPLNMDDPAASIDVEPVRVDALYRLVLPIAPQKFNLPLPSGDHREIDARIVGIEARYLPGRARLTVDVGF